MVLSDYILRTQACYTCYYTSVLPISFVLIELHSNLFLLLFRPLCRPITSGKLTVCCGGV